MKSIQSQSVKDLTYAKTEHIKQFRRPTKSEHRTEKRFGSCMIYTKKVKRQYLYINNIKLSYSPIYILQFKIISTIDKWLHDGSYTSCK